MSEGTLLRLVQGSQSRKRRRAEEGEGEEGGKYESVGASWLSKNLDILAKRQPPKVELGETQAKNKGEGERAALRRAVENLLEFETPENVKIFVEGVIIQAKSLRTVETRTGHKRPINIKKKKPLESAPNAPEPNSSSKALEESMSSESKATPASTPRAQQT